MLCEHPYYYDPWGHTLRSATYGEGEHWQGIPFPCGQCLACRINRRKVWLHRIMLESYKWESNAFVTLTYRDEDLPFALNAPLPSLCKRDLQLFVKRVRERLRYECNNSDGSDSSDVSSKVRYYACGEYGELSKRPHYHLCLFNIDPFATGKMIADCWPYGMVHIGSLELASASYVAGYVTKKIVKKDDLCGRTPEFAVMSLKPAIGVPALDDIVELVRTNEAFEKYVAVAGDQIVGLKHGQRSLPLGRFLKTKLCERLNIDMKPLKEAYWYKMKGKTLWGRRLKDVIDEESKQVLANKRSRFRIFNRRNKI